MFTTEKLSQIFNQFCHKNVLIIGDVMLDHYLFGKVSRFSPEAPVPVVALEKQRTMLGGASNVALNIKALGANPILCSVIGNDERGRTLQRLMEEDTMPTIGLMTSTERQTTIKSRVIGNSVQLVRIDEEDTQPLSPTEEEQFLSHIQQMMVTTAIDVVLFQDYDKGTITPKIISTITQIAHERNIPITVDPKKRNFLEYKDVTLFKPNLKELSEGIGKNPEASNTASLQEAVTALREVLRPELVLLTLSEHGVAISDNNTWHHFPAFLRHISDVSGAGDTVISVATLCLALHLPIEDMAQLSNLAGGLVCEQVGVVPVNKELLLQEAQRQLTPATLQ